MSAALRIAGPLLLIAALSGCKTPPSETTAAATSTPTIYTVTLSGDQEVPPVKTNASGRATVRVDPATMSITGSITTVGITGTAAHIHEGTAGTNGPVVIPFVQSKEGIWVIPETAKLSAAQYNNLTAGNLYVNVHTTTAPGGEIRGQLK